MKGRIRVGLKEALAGILVFGALVFGLVATDLPPGALFMSSFLVMGLLALALSLRTLVRSLQRSQFEPVEATVQHSEVRTQTETGTGPQTTTYIPKITYEYTVDGQTYESDSVYPVMGGSNNAEKQQSVVEDHPAGATVEAFYHPEDHSRSYLVENSSTPQAVVGILVGLVLSAVGVYGVLGAL